MAVVLECSTGQSRVTREEDIGHLHCFGLACLGRGKVLFINDVGDR